MTRTPRALQARVRIQLGDIVGAQEVLTQLPKDAARALRCEAGLMRADLLRAVGNFTAAQERVFGEIEADLQRSQPMARLVQGDVGSGKTVVAIAALLSTISCGWQGALMAPTEVLAEQHHRSWRRKISACLA